MTSVVSWNTPETTHIALQVTSDLASNANKVGNQLNPSGYLYSSWDFFGQFYASPTDGGTIDLYLLPAVDDVNFSTGDSLIIPPATSYVGSFPLYPNANSGMHIPIVNVPMSPLLIKPAIRNSSGQTIPANSGTLKVRLYGEKIV